MNNVTMKCILVPEDIIRSVKDEKNKPLVGIDYSTMSNSNMFLMRSNVAYICKHIYGLHRQYGGRLPEYLYVEAIPEMMRMWAIKENLDSFEGGFNWVLTLDYINNKFVDDNLEYYAQEGVDTNVFRTIAPVGTMNEYDGKKYQSKKYREMTAADYQTLDVYGPLKTYISNDGPYRNGNKFPVNQRSVNKRQFSRENDGLRSENWARASLEVPIRGYDMSTIIEQTGKYNDLSWTEF